MLVVSRAKCALKKSEPSETHKFLHTWCGDGQLLQRPVSSIWSASFMQRSSSRNVLNSVSWKVAHVSHLFLAHVGGRMSARAWVPSARDVVADNVVVPQALPLDSFRDTELSGVDSEVDASPSCWWAFLRVSRQGPKPCLAEHVVIAVTPSRKS